MSFSKVPKIENFGILGNLRVCFGIILELFGALPRKINDDMVRSTLLHPFFPGGPKGKIRGFNITRDIWISSLIIVSTFYKNIPWHIWTKKNITRTFQIYSQS